MPNDKKKSEIIRNIQEYRRVFFPKAVIAERERQESGADFGERLAKSSLEKLRKHLRES